MTYIPGWDAIAVMAANLGASFVASELNIRISFPQTGDYRDFEDTELERRDAIRWMHAEIKFVESLQWKAFNQPQGRTVRPTVPKFE